ncbi:sulfotransferase family protein [Bacillus sp. OK048]|uniref:sulfotransferase family protein n=1 Tax=Bacillus sp. OK048 TaxID=1882761 RepID=UPI00088E1383|nr:hypothetical protein [Bacillus sp. OK048]SDN52689.1 hypothetical protein SAMN05443253_11370 [Bacillus sp. OK048]
MEEKSKLFLILCLHRSGSSATAGVMQLLGVHMGDRLIQATKHNQKGHFENVEFVQLNQEILKSVNSTWNKLPNLEKIPETKMLVTKIRTFINKNKKPIWGLKDPRTLITFELWKPYLEEVADIHYVFVHRPFEASVRSLANRDRNTIGAANLILTPYLKKLYHYRHNFGLPPEKIIDVSFQDILNDPEEFVSQINNKNGNPPDYRLNETKAFLDKRLQTF